MAKDSFILSQTRGGVGNLVVRRSNGKTIVSAKPTSVSNPRTYAQAEVRMRLATVSKFYSPLSGYLQQGVQGKNTQNSMSAFSSAAIALMKEQGLSAPKEAEWWPMPFRLAKGSVPPLMYEFSYVPGSVSVVDFDAFTSDITTVGNFASYIKSACAIPVDRFQMTIVVAYRQALASDRFAFYPYVHRIFLDSNSANNVSTLSNERLSFSPALIGDTNVFSIAGTAAYWAVGVALIISYWDGRQWVRSTSELQIAPEVLAEFQSNYDANVATFMNSAAATDPEGRVYLDGYTRRAGGDVPSIDWSQYTIAIGDEASTAKIASLEAKSSGATAGVECIFVTLDNSQSFVLQGNDKMSSFEKAFRVDGGTKVSIPEAVIAVSVTSEPGYYDFYSAVADLFGLPVSYMFT